MKRQDIAQWLSEGHRSKPTGETIRAWLHGILTASASPKFLEMFSVEGGQITIEPRALITNRVYRGHQV